MTTYLSPNPANDPITRTAIDTGVATAPFDRPSVLTPPTGYVATGSSVDYGVGATPAVRPMCFEAQSVSVTIDIGLAASG